MWNIQIMLKYFNHECGGELTERVADNACSKRFSTQTALENFLLPVFVVVVNLGFRVGELFSTKWPLVCWSGDSHKN